MHRRFPDGDFTDDSQTIKYGKSPPYHPYSARSHSLSLGQW